MMTDEEQQKIIVMMVELSGKIQMLLDKQDELAETILTRLRRQYTIQTQDYMLVLRILMRAFRISKIGRQQTPESYGSLAAQSQRF